MNPAETATKLTEQIDLLDQAMLILCKALTNTDDMLIVDAIKYCSKARTTAAVLYMQAQFAQMGNTTKDVIDE